MFYSNLNVWCELIGRFFNSLLVNQNYSGHDHRLRLCARLSESSFYEKFVDAFASHGGNITVECRELSLFGSGGPAGSAGDGARRVVQAEFGGAVVTKPDDDVWRIRPEEGTYPAGDLYCVVNAQSLQRLKVKHAVVKIALNTFVSVNTLPLTEHLSRHNEHPSFFRATRITVLNMKCRGFL